MKGFDFGQITLDDALNDPNLLSFSPARPLLTARITCVVCNAKADVTAGPLCDLCRADLDATERHIRETLAAAEQTLHDTWTRWDADLAHAEGADQERYRRVCAAQGTPGFAERYKRALDKGDGLSVLLRSAERAEAATTAMERTQARGGVALEEVFAARSAR